MNLVVLGGVVQIGRLRLIREDMYINMSNLLFFRSSGETL